MSSQACLWHKFMPRCAAFTQFFVAWLRCRVPGRLDSPFYRTNVKVAYVRSRLISPVNLGNCAISDPSVYPDLLPTFSVQPSTKSDASPSDRIQRAVHGRLSRATILNVLSANTTRSRTILFYTLLLLHATSVC